MPVQVLNYFLGRRLLLWADSNNSPWPCIALHLRLSEHNVELLRASLPLELRSHLCYRRNWGNPVPTRGSRQQQSIALLHPTLLASGGNKEAKGEGKLGERNLHRVEQSIVFAICFQCHSWLPVSLVNITFNFSWATTHTYTLVVENSWEERTGKLLEVVSWRELQTLHT